MLKIAILSLALAFFSANCLADDSTYVEYVFDGDTVNIHQLSSEYKLRLSDIDAPEKNQPVGKESRRALIKLCMNQPMNVQLLGTDQYNRQLGHLQCNQIDAGLYLVKNGWAWYSAKYSNDKEIMQAEKTARLNKLGLWKNKNPVPPWIWRKQHPYTNPTRNSRFN